MNDKTRAKIKALAEGSYNFGMVRCRAIALEDIREYLLARAAEIAAHPDRKIYKEIEKLVKQGKLLEAMGMFNYFVTEFSLEGLDDTPITCYHA